MKPLSGESSIILVVEDNFDLRNFICEQLENGYSVIEAVDGEKGVRACRRYYPRFSDK